MTSMVLLYTDVCAAVVEHGYVNKLLSIEHRSLYIARYDNML